MTPEQIEELRPAFADYPQQFLFYCDYTKTVDLLGVYCRAACSPTGEGRLRVAGRGRALLGSPPGGARQCLL
jgi:hypothetical protein